MSGFERRTLLLAAGALLGMPLARAQQPPAAGYLIGILEYGTRAESETGIARFKDGLRE